MRCALSTAVLVAVLAAAAPAGAQASGNIRGRVRAFDFRENPYEQAGFAAGAIPAGARITTGFEDQTLRPVREVWVQLFVYETDSVYTIWYTRTNQLGFYSIDWSEAFTPIRLRVSVLAKRPNLAAGIATKTRPSTVFSIGNGSTLLRVRTLDEGAISDSVVNFNIREASETVSAYLTTREVYAMWWAHGDGVAGGSIRSSMQGVKVVPNAWGDFFGGAGLTLTDSTIQLGARTATRSPFTVAHELGHALVWRALELPLALIGPADYSCTFPDRADANPGWDDFSYECEKAAFHDALANLNAALWMWRRDSTNRIVPRGPNPWGLEGAGTCAEGPDEENRVACNTRALWDVVDTPNDALDNRDLLDVVSVLRAYPWCLCGFDNGCSNEGYPWDDLACPIVDLDASNWKDFKRNWIQLFGQADEMDEIERGNGLTAQTEL